MIKKGFTLVELIIVISLIAIISSITFNFYNINKSVFVKLDLEKFHNICLYVQRRASLEDKTYIIKIDPRLNKYYLYSKENLKSKKEYIKVYSLSNYAQFRVRPGIKNSPSEHENNILSSITFRGHMIFFYPDGNISAGTIYFSDKNYNHNYALSCAVSKKSLLRRYVYNSLNSSWDILN